MEIEQADQWTQNNWLEFTDEFSELIDLMDVQVVPVALNVGDIIEHTFFNEPGLKNCSIVTEVYKVTHCFDIDEKEYYRKVSAKIPKHIFK
jgi:hypothetical protein